MLNPINDYLVRLMNLDCFQPLTQISALVLLVDFIESTTCSTDLNFSIKKILKSFSLLNIELHTLRFTEPFRFAFNKFWKSLKPQLSIESHFEEW